MANREVASDECHTYELTWGPVPDVTDAHRDVHAAIIPTTLHQKYLYVLAPVTKAYKCTPPARDP